MILKTTKFNIICKQTVNKFQSPLTNIKTRAILYTQQNDSKEYPNGVEQPS